MNLDNLFYLSKGVSLSGKQKFYLRHFSGLTVTHPVKAADYLQLKLEVMGGVSKGRDKPSHCQVN